MLDVLDRQVLIDLGPSYFKYMESTATRPTVLAKLLGFYTVEIRNLETGTTQAKADLLVMENLFYDRKISKTFDLKGIQGRKVKASASANSKTLFDGEWIEGGDCLDNKSSPTLTPANFRPAACADPRASAFQGGSTGSAESRLRLPREEQHYGL